MLGFRFEHLLMLHTYLLLCSLSSRAPLPFLSLSLSPLSLHHSLPSPPYLQCSVLQLVCTLFFPLHSLSLSSKVDFELSFAKRQE